MKTMPAIIELKPYYAAVAILVGLVILHGLACEIGFVNYDGVL